MSDPFITVSVRMQKSIYESMVHIARDATKKTGMEINVDAVISTACQASAEEQSPTGRQVTIKYQ